MKKVFKTTPVRRMGGGHGGKTLHKPIYEHDGKYYIKGEEVYTPLFYNNEKYSEVVCDDGKMWFIK